MGAALLVVVPVPSWPYSLSPQQYAAPDATTPQAEDPPTSPVPTSIDLKVSAASTAVGVGDELPQQYAMPSRDSAQFRYMLACTDAKRRSGRTGIGTVLHRPTRVPW